MKSCYLEMSTATDISRLFQRGKFEYRVELLSDLHQSGLADLGAAL